MAIGWIAAFKAIPWPQVIEAAPTVVRGARTLWQNVKTNDEALAAAQAETSDAATEDPRDGLMKHLARTEGRLAELEEQQRASSELIATLAEQNATLVEAVEILRVRNRNLALAGVVLGLTLAAAIWMLAA